MLFWKSFHVFNHFSSWEINSYLRPVSQHRETRTANLSFIKHCQMTITSTTRAWHQARVATCYTTTPPFLNFVVYWISIIRQGGSLIKDWIKQTFLKITDLYLVIALRLWKLKRYSKNTFLKCWVCSQNLKH